MKKFSTLILASLCLFFTNSAMAQNATLPTVDAAELAPSQSLQNVTTAVDQLKTTTGAVTSALPEDAVVLWGGAGDANGEFDGGLNDWTTEGFIPATTTPEPGSLWTYEADADINEGAFAMTGAANNPMSSPSADNGAAAFNSDFYDNDGDDTNFGMGMLPGPHLSHLISPVIDMTDNTELAVSFFSFRRRFLSRATISYSNDGGTTWSEAIDVYNDDRETRTNGPVLDSEQLVYLPGAGGTDEFQFRFTFDGNYYFWMIDDVALIEAPRNDVKIESFFYTPAAYAQPLRHIDKDTFGFSVKIRNQGTVAQTNVALGAQVRNSDLSIIYETEIILDEFPVGATDSVTIPGTYIPDNLGEGEYLLTYTVEADSVDQWDVDNTEGDGFAVTELIFSAEADDEGTANEIFTTLGGAGAWQIGNTYTTGEGFGDDYYTAESITFAAEVAAGENLAGQSVNVWLLAFNDNDFDNMARFDNNAGLDVIGFGAHTYTTESEGDRITVSLEDFSGNTEIVLAENQEYLVLVDYSTSPDLRQGFNTSIDYLHGGRNTFLAFNEGSSSWFGGFTDSENLLPIIRLQMGLVVVGTNDQQLAASTLNVQPNPVSDLLTVNVDLETTSKAVLTVTDITGRIMEIQEFDAIDNQNINMNVGNYANGTYLVRLATEAGARTVKVLVQH